MSCVADRTLWLIHEGEARPAEHAHVRVCPACAARYDRLVRDLEVLAHALRALPAGAPVRRWAPAFGWRRLALSAALVVLVALAGVQAWRAQPARPPVSAVSATAEVLPFLAEVSVVLSPAGPSGLAGIETAWLGEGAPPVSPETGLDSLLSWDPSMDADIDRDAETESDT